MNRSAFLLFLVLLGHLAPIVASTDPSKFKAFLLKNVRPGTGLPQSYRLWPTNYFRTVPEALRPHDYNTSQMAPQCGGEMVAGEKWNAYEFQTEELLTATGLNIYDGSVWAIALSLLGEHDKVSAHHHMLMGGKTLQFGDIRGNNPCAGVMSWNECKDPHSVGACGLCYGDAPGNAGKTVSLLNAFFFRMIGDIYAFDGTTLALCPEKNLRWVWNDWKPVLGENAWATMLGPLQAAYHRAQGNVDAIDDNGVEMMLAINLLPTLVKMQIPIGALYYSPRNMYYRLNANVGSTVSTENNASLLAGLKALLYILTNKKSTSHAWAIDVVKRLIDGILKYLKSAFDTQNGYFRQGGSYDPHTGTFSWGQGSSIPLFATDCQTWVSTVLGPNLVDQWFGNGTSMKLWHHTAHHAGVHDASGNIIGVGYTENADAQVFSGEWSFGATNWLRVMLNESKLTADDRAELTQVVQNVRAAVEANLTHDIGMPDGSKAPGVLYANRRYFIPFGWWANPLASMASTGWAVFHDLGCNPFMLNCAFTAQYPGTKWPPAPLPPGPTPSPPGPEPSPSPSPNPNGCNVCGPNSHACCAYGQLCPGDIPCCNCGIPGACECPTKPPSPGPSPDPHKCHDCSAHSRVCCHTGQKCPGGSDCCACTSGNCECPQAYNSSIPISL